MGTAPIALTMMGGVFDDPKWPSERLLHSCSLICPLAPGLSADLLFFVKAGKTVVSRGIKSNPCHTPLRIKSLSKSLASSFAHISYFKCVEIQAASRCCA